MEVESLITILQELMPDLPLTNLKAVDPQKVIKKLGVCVDPTETAIESATGKGVDLLLSYHPWKGEADKIVQVSSLPIIPIHTAWDNAPEGINQTLAKALGLTDLYRVEDLLIGTSEALMLRDVLDRCQRVLDLNVVPYLGELKSPVQKVGIWAGPGFLPHHLKILELFLAQGCDTILSGELSLLAIRFSNKHKLKMVDLGHSAIAKPGMAHLVELLKYRLKALKCSVEFFNDYYGCNYYTNYCYFSQQFEPDENLNLFSLTDKLE